MKTDTPIERSVASKLVLGLTAGAGACWALNRLMRSRRRINLSGSSALVTGGSRGLELALARLLLRRGAKVAICARDEEELRIAEADLARLGREAHAVVCDLTDPVQIRAMVTEWR